MTETVAYSSGWFVDLSRILPVTAPSGFDWALKRVVKQENIVVIKTI
jgi:hypothetical protein